jgi:uncharacterized protein YfaA (DUF2138 family)
MDDEITAEQIAQHFSAMDDSVELINAIVADDTDALSRDTAQEVKLMVTRNTDHLEIQAAKTWYSESELSKTAYVNAVTAGKAYVEG